MKIKIPFLYILLTASVIISCKNTIKKSEYEASDSSSDIKVLTRKNETKIIQNENVIEVFQKFTSQNSSNEVISETTAIDLTVTSGAMISAYSVNKGNYSLFYRTLEKNSWSNWIKLDENNEANNPNRRVFSPKSLNSLVTEIQFKSNQVIESDVIFRIYTFKKQ